MKEHIERILELGLAMLLITAALASVYRITSSVGSLIEKHHANRRNYSAEFSPRLSPRNSYEQTENLNKRLDKYYIASEFRRTSELAAEEHFVYIDGKKISLNKEDEAEGIKDSRGHRLSAGELRPMLDIVVEEDLNYYFKDSKLYRIELR